MANRSYIWFLLLISFFISSGNNQANALDYDYSYTSECLAEPVKPQYGGGIVVNPELNGGLKGWLPFQGAKIEIRKSNNGNNFIVATNRNDYHDSISQKFNLEKEKFYIISAWLQVSNSSANVAAIVKTSNDSHYAGWSIAQSGCWSLFKGGVVVDHPSIELWVDSLSVQPFSQEEWSSHLRQNVEKIRKSKVKLRAVDAEGFPLVNASLSIVPDQQHHHHHHHSSFHFGNAVSNRILTIPAYRKWFTKRFKYTVFENEMKWKWNEPQQGHIDFGFADGMLKFVKHHNIHARGHNVVWDSYEAVPDWAKKLPPKELEKATKNRQFAIMGRYSGQFIHWDVVNENLHFSYYETMLGKTASSVFYKRAHNIDKNAILFLNDFNTIENPRDKVSSPRNYFGKIQEMRSQGFRGPLGIGLEGHFYMPPNLPYIRTTLDALATAHLPIWITELDVDSTWPQAAVYLEQILRELHAHHAVNGVIIWAPWSPPQCYRMCITDANFRNLPTGNVVDKLLGEWNHLGFEGITDSNGYFHTTLSHGVYQVKVNHSAAANSSRTYNIEQKLVVKLMNMSNEKTKQEAIEAVADIYGFSLSTALKQVDRAEAQQKGRCLIPNCSWASYCHHHKLSTTLLHSGENFHNNAAYGGGTSAL
ncbi:hypothetical protein ACH5RR_041548 [Cinchona calisaya]|uniref:GH10 domain-containing protein n=1 Tax=Cinchona calisaya TaxID=153742 RepID=A0ABD2XTX5_9GENT